MPERDEQGHFISAEEAERKRRVAAEDEEGEEGEGGDESEEYTRPRGWAPPETQPEQPVFVDTGRSNAIPVSAGSPFVATLERIAEQHNYGHYFRVFLNGSEVVNPEDSPETIEAGMRIAITPYDKVG